MAPLVEPDAHHTVPPVDLLCATLVSDLGVSGASISVVSYRGRQSTICSTDPTAARAEALQFELGEGPHWDALSTRGPVLAPDLGSARETRWPLFTDGVRGLGIEAVFAFPMLMGAALVGVVDLYSTSPREVDDEFITRASFGAGRAATTAVHRAIQSAADHESPESPMAPALRREVHQATGMVLVQLDISATDAFSRLQGHAFFTGRPIDDVAHDVVQGRLQFDKIPDE